MSKELTTVFLIRAANHGKSNAVELSRKLREYLCIITNGGSRYENQAANRLIDSVDEVISELAKLP